VTSRPTKSASSSSPTPARRISLAEAQRFEELHAKVYRSLGYELITVEPGPLDLRVAAVLVRVAAVLAQASDIPGTT
jgi:predicted ATPase